MILLLLACTATTPGPASPERRLDDHERPPLQRLQPLDATRATLTAAPHVLSIDGAERPGYAYNEQVPGPLLTAQVGDTLEVELLNGLDTGTTIHWHGAGATYEMDGVPWQRGPTPAGGSFTYTFPLERSGTFWYHPHFDTERQVDLGLYGVLIVHDPAEPAVDDDIAIVLDSWGETDRDPHDHGLDGQALRWSVNGSIDPLADVQGRWVRLRILNASNTGYVDLDTAGMTVLATDQGIGNAPWVADSVVLSPGDRVELLVEVDGEVELISHPFSLHGGRAWGEPERLMSLTSNDDGVQPQWTQPAVPPSQDPGHTDVTYTFQGDNGADVWRINHEVFPDVTIETVSLQEDVVVEIRNLSPTHHPFHGHGHAFEVLSIDGQAPSQRRVEDTVDVGIHETLRVRFTADKPGDWMQHCHILPHADGGMMTVLRVEP